MRNGCANTRSRPAITGSHRWEDDREEVDLALSSPAVMTKGSVLLYLGSVFHGGGASTTKASRIGINVGYSLGWLPQEENQYLACPPEIARALPEGLLRLMGYRRGSYAIGYVDNMREPLDGCTAARRLCRTSTITAAPLASGSRRPGATFHPRGLSPDATETRILRPRAPARGSSVRPAQLPEIAVIGIQAQVGPDLPHPIVLLALGRPQRLVPDDRERLRLSRRHTTLMINGNRRSSLFLA
jgi:hypothetical protein